MDELTHVNQWVKRPGRGARVLHREARDGVTRRRNRARDRQLPLAHGRARRAAGHRGRADDSSRPARVRRGDRRPAPRSWSRRAPPADLLLDRRLQGHLRGAQPASASSSRRSRWTGPTGRRRVPRPLGESGQARSGRMTASAGRVGANEVHARRPVESLQRATPERVPARVSSGMDGLERKWWTLIAVCTAIFMLLLDITVVNVALPDIQRELDASFVQLQWVVDAYALTLATTVLAAGSLADLFGRRRVFDRTGVFTRRRSAADLERRRGADRRASGSGRRRRNHVRRLAGAARERVPWPRARHRVRDLGRDHRRCNRDRPARRRRSHRVGRLALDLLRQHPDRVAAIAVTMLRADESRNPVPLGWTGWGQPP